MKILTVPVIFCLFFRLQYLISIIHSKSRKASFYVIYSISGVQMSAEHGDSNKTVLEPGARP